jgi:hypothetical protein
MFLMPTFLSIKWIAANVTAVIGHTDIVNLFVTRMTLI